MTKHKTIELGFIESGLKMIPPDAYHWHELSPHHLRAARILTESVRQIEAMPERTSEQIADHRALTVTAIISVVNFVESFVNEIFCASMYNTASLQPLTKSVISHICSTWTCPGSNIDRYEILDKYDKLLSCVSQPPIKRGEAPAQCVNTTICVRNYLVHYKPEPVPALQASQASSKLQARLPKSLASVPWFKSRAKPYFPDHYLGHSLCAWAHESALKMTLTVRKQLGLTHHWLDSI